MSDFFVNEEEKETKSRKPAVQERENSSKIPANYIPIKLSSLGKLSVPKIIHIRNYNGEDALKLAMTSVSDEPDDAMFKVLLEVLNNMIFEDIDSLDLHQKEMEEIMLNVYLNWWSQYIQEVPYQPEEEELIATKYCSQETIDKVKKGEDTLTTTIDLKKLNTENILSDFKEPITLTTNNLSCKFNLPRVGDSVRASDFVENKYVSKESKFTAIQSDIQFNIRNKNNPNVKERPIDKDLYAEYIEYRNERNSDFVKYERMCSIIEVNGKAVSEENMFELYKLIDLKTLNVIKNTTEKYSGFGVDENNVPMVSPITREEVIRRFQFRALDFIPTMDVQDDTGYSISFGT